MTTSRIFATTAVALLMGGTLAVAQSLNGPANLPPTSFAGQQFNDNNGCAFVRAGVSGATVWVARVDQSRNPICGLTPTFDAVAPVVIAEPAPAETAPASAVAPVRNSNVGAPTNTVATLTTAPRVAAAPMAPVAAAPRRTLAEACEGRTGIQPGLISSATGEPVDCGGAPQAAPAPAERRMTVAQICAATAATGQTFINQANGQPVACPVATTPAPVVLAASGAQAPQDVPRLTRADACALGQQTGTRYIDAATGAPIDCAPVMATLTSPLTDVPDLTLVPAQPPASNPTGVVQAYSGPPPGYEPVWSDGRLNQSRGFPPIALSQFRATGVTSDPRFMPLSEGQMAARLAQTAGAQGVAAERVSTRNVPQAAVLQAYAGHRFVQIGTFGDPANADRAAAALRGLGLPVGLSAISGNGTALQSVSAGPFASVAELQAALLAARAAGFADAFTRS